jgi:hypothetical protein
VNPKEFQATVEASAAAAAAAGHTRAAQAAAFEAQRQGAERQAMRDWWLLAASDVLVGGLTGALSSGFSASAGLVAPKQQAVYAMEGFDWPNPHKKGHGCATGGGKATRLQSQAAGPRSFMCASRFCG